MLYFKAVFSFSTATKADSFALYFLGECNNVSTRSFAWIRSFRRRLLFRSLLSLLLNRVYVYSLQWGPKMAIQTSSPPAPSHMGQPSPLMLPRLAKHCWWRTSWGYGCRPGTGTMPVITTRRQLDFSRSLRKTIPCLI